MRLLEINKCSNLLFQLMLGWGRIFLRSISFHHTCLSLMASRGLQSSIVLQLRPGGGGRSAGMMWWNANWLIDQQNCYKLVCAQPADSDRGYWLWGDFLQWTDLEGSNNYPARSCVAAPSPGKSTSSFIRFYRRCWSIIVSEQRRLRLPTNDIRSSLPTMSTGRHWVISLRGDYANPLG